GQPVPVLAAEVLDGLDQAVAVLLGGSGERGAVTGPRVGVEVAERVAPGLPVLGHVGVPPAVGLPRGQTRLDQLRDGHRGVVPVLAGEVIEEGVSTAPFVIVKKRDYLR